MKKLIVILLFAFSFIGLSAQTTHTIYNHSQYGELYFELTENIKTDTTYSFKFIDERTFSGLYLTIFLKNETALREFLDDIDNVKEGEVNSNLYYSITRVNGQVSIWDRRSQGFILYSKYTFPKMNEAVFEWFDKE